jgi:hypothetical protein
MKRLPAITTSAAAVAVSLLTPALANATIHSGRVVLPEPRNPASIGVPPPPAVQAHERDHEVVIRYNASVGSVTFVDELWDPHYWGETLSESFSLGPKCEDRYFSGASEFQAHIEAYPKRIELGTERGGVAGKATLRGFTGQVLSEGTFNGTRFEITYRSNEFRNRNWRCAEISERTAKPTLFRPDITFHLDNWPRPKRHKRS